jgi:hypothetical protein
VQVPEPVPRTTALTQGWIDIVSETPGWRFEQRGTEYTVYPRRNRTDIPTEYLRPITLPVFMPNVGATPDNKRAELRRAGLFDDHEQAMEAKKVTNVTTIRASAEKPPEVPAPKLDTQAEILTAIKARATLVVDHATELVALVDRLEDQGEQDAQAKEELQGALAILKKQGLL